MEERKTRKNKRLLIVSAMLILLLAILCIGGVTFAKYVTKTDVPTQQATVAKWGFVVTANTNNLFGEKYKYDGTSKSTITTDTSGLSIAADSTGGKRLAPGASGSMSISIGGKAEVASTIAFTKGTIKDISIKYDAYTKDDEDKTPVAAGTYAPVKWTLKKGGTEIPTTNKTLSECLDAVVSDILRTLGIAKGTIIPPNTELTTANYELSWEWKFDNSAITERADEFDTLLAAYAAETNDDKKAEMLTDAGCSDAQTELSFNFGIAIEQSETGATA